MIIFPCAFQTTFFTVLLFFLTVPLLQPCLSYAHAQPQKIEEDAPSSRSSLDAYVAPFLPHKNAALLDLIICHALGYKNFQAFKLDERASYLNLIKAIGLTLAEGALVIPVVNLIPEWQESHKQLIHNSLEVKREYISKCADLASALATGLAFHMHYDSTFPAHSSKAEAPAKPYLKLLGIAAANTAEGLTFESIASLGAWSTDQALDFLNSFLPLKKFDTLIVSLFPNSESLILDLVICHALGHKNYHDVGLDQQPSFVGLLKVVVLTLKEGLIVIPLISIASSLEEGFRKKIESFCAIKRENLVWLIDIASDLTLGLAFHMHYDHSFETLDSHSTTPSHRLLVLAGIMALNTAEWMTAYVSFYSIGTAFDRSIDYANTYFSEQPMHQKSEL